MTIPSDGPGASVVVVVVGGSGSTPGGAPHATSDDGPSPAALERDHSEAALAGAEIHIGELRRLIGELERAARGNVGVLVREDVDDLGCGGRGACGDVEFRRDLELAVGGIRAEHSVAGGIRQGLPGEPYLA